MSRQQAIAWLLERCPDVTELQAGRMLDYAVSNAAAMVGEYTVTWDPEAGFALWPPGIPEHVIPVGGAEAEAMAGATGRARLRAGQVVSAHGGAGTPAAWAALAAEGTAAVDEAISTYQHGDGPDRDLLDHDQAAWLSVTLGDTRVVRHAWARMDPARQAAHQVLWSDVTRSARPGHVAAPASLLAFTALQGNNERLADASLDRALADQPGYPPATLLRAARAAGLPAARYAPETLPLPAPRAASPARTADGQPGVPAIRPGRTDPELEPLSAGGRPAPPHQPRPAGPGDWDGIGDHPRQAPRRRRVRSGLWCLPSRWDRLGASRRNGTIPPSRPAPGSNRAPGPRTDHPSEGEPYD